MSDLKTTNKGKILELMPTIMEMRDRATIAAIHSHLTQSGEISCALSTFKRIFYQLRETSAPALNQPPVPPAATPPAVPKSGRIGTDFNLRAHQSMSNAYFEEARS